MQPHPTRHRARLMARPAGLPCPECEGMLNRVTAATPLLCMCGVSLKVTETREDPEHAVAPAVWRLRECTGTDPDADIHAIATVQFIAPLDAVEAPGGRWHRCLDCGAVFSSLERQVNLQEAQERLRALARERVMLARAGRRDPWAATRQLEPNVAWHLEGR